MNMNKKENIAVVTSALLFSVAFMHLLRAVLGVEMTVAGVSIGLWLSWVLGLGIGILAILNFKTIRDRDKVVWLKLLQWFFVIDALGAFYSWVSDLSYWGFTRVLFGWGVIFDLVVIAFLAWKIKKMQ